MSAIIGVKKGMTQVFTEKGNEVPCTVVDTSGVYFIGRRTQKKDGYDAVILGLGKKKEKNQIESEKGIYKELGFVPVRVFEFRSRNCNLEMFKDLKAGDEVKTSIFKVGDLVDVYGKTKGKGFQGVMKRWGFKGGPRTRGQSDRQRAPGSIGGGTDPGRVFKGKKMPGHMGDVNKTVRNLEVVDVNDDDSYICIKGAVPGAKNNVIKIYSK